jgi:hypothetical protein
MVTHAAAMLKIRTIIAAARRKASDVYETAGKSSDRRAHTVGCVVVWWDVEFEENKRSEVIISNFSPSNFRLNSLASAEAGPRRS